VRDSRLRRSERRLVIEGPHLLTAAIEAGIQPVAVLGTEAGLVRPEVAALKLKVTPTVMTPSVFAAIADAETAPGIAAEIELPSRKRDGSLVLLEGVQDPGNVGAIIRSAAAFGVGTVVLDRQSADPWSPKVLRAGQGGHFALAVRQVDDLLPAAEGRRLICTVVQGGRPLRDADLSGAIAWAFGAEGAGLSADLVAKAAERVTIPMAGGESLNVAATAAICLYQAFAGSPPSRGRQPGRPNTPAAGS
jgi:TrmH family RNA methyltransferase